MRTLDRLLYFLLALLLIAFCGAMVYMMIEPDQSAMMVDNFIYNVRHLWYLKVAVGAGVLVVLLLTLKVLFSRSGPGRAREPKQIAISANGNVRITADAVNEIIIETAKANMNVRDAKCVLDQQGEAGLSVMLTIYVDGDISIPEIAEALNNEISATMENICGIVPANVRILVEKNQTQGVGVVR